MRANLIQHKSGVFTPDTIDALRKLEKRVSKLSARLHVKGRSALEVGWGAVRDDPGPTGLPPEWSAVPAGREVYLRLEILNDEEGDGSRQERELAMLWGMAVPLGFVPYARYPLRGPHADVFHFLGEWEILMDQLLGAGRGEAGWPAFCCAAQLDVGKWEGPRPTERLVQAHLHRIGFPVGPIDGILGNKTQGALRAASLHSIPLSDVAERIEKMPARVAKFTDRALQGRVELPDVSFAIHPYGQVRATRTVQGADLQISGPGRVVIDVRDPPE
jgi:hypothetical protein